MCFDILKQKVRKKNQQREKLTNLLTIKSKIKQKQDKIDFLIYVFDLRERLDLQALFFCFVFSFLFDFKF